MAKAIEHSRRSGQERSVPLARPLLVVDRTRMLYRGHWHAAHHRRLGAHVIYIGFNAPFRLNVGDGWQSAEMACIEPGHLHSVEGGDGTIGELSLESETLASDDLPEPLGCSTGAVRDPQVIDRWRSACASYLPTQPGAGSIAASLDRHFFGRVLPPRPLDPRIAAIISTICEDPFARHSATHLARGVGLSDSRMLHVFTAETGVPFRRFCGWKRARGLLSFVTTPASLTEIALQAGYSDAAHFSHAIRDFTGIKPKDIVAAMRGIAVVAPTAARTGAA
jgi:AraC-like DNA-binding protein